ncbi:electron transfer flavoprotein subunit beta [Aquitalea palustris]|uniref:Electron transfer flavoprotein subunit beta n=1 Tax=Aquitalea palustris TaxID=2480983 RepID=A0A454JG47_9NEIS|nr:electron transfer flavoprotein subunit beta [Aquitalea palustris]RMC95162.1 electron transfer flavoprotein subunit beta [Aquitalea palustris]
MKIAVLVAPAVHPVSGRPCAGEADLAALALAQRLSSQVDVWYAGAADDAALADYLARGADNIHSLSLSPGSDVLAALCSVLQGVDMVLCGARAGGGDGSGLLPYQLAEQLGRALLPDVLDLSKSDQQWQALQALPKGVRRTLAAKLPLVASVHARAASAVGWSYARLQQGKIQRKAATGAALPQVVLEPARRARALVAASKVSGHARMQGAIAGGEGKSAGIVVKQGDSVEKAQVVLDYLRQHQLVDF